MYEAVTRGIRVSVTPSYLEEESTPEENYFFWAYTVVIANEGNETVQLKSRVWRITDARGNTEEVRGPGVVGQTPVIPPGESFTYTSGCPLRTPQGIMVGSYQMTDARGELFDVAIPAFSLDSPFAARKMHKSGCEFGPRRLRPPRWSVQAIMSPPAYSAKEMLAKLVGFDTTSEETNLPLIAFVKHYLAQYGIESHLVPSEDGHKAGLFATIGPKDAAGVGLSGHTDVVPITDQSWNTDPFTLVEKDGRLYGRGAADMKSYLACVLAAVPEFQRRRLNVPIHIVLSYDEEVGCVGVRPMIAELGTRLPRPRMVIVGEPTSMTVVDAHKGPVRWQVDVTGRAAHSSMAPLGVNAISYAGRLLGELDRIEQELKASPRNERFTPAYTTLQVTRIAAGTANNIVPNLCWFGWEVRALPGLDIGALERRLMAFAAKHCLPEMKSVAAEADIIIQRTNEVPAFAADPGSEVVALTLKLSQGTETQAVSFATEAGLFQAARAAAVVCGPGDIAQAHTANEWIAAAELDKCTGFLMRLADWAAG